MKKPLLLFALLFCILQASTQVKLQPIRSDVKYYIGKTFKMKELDPLIRPDGYSNLVYDIDQIGGTGNTPYPGTKYYFMSVYDSLVNKTFKCVDAGTSKRSSQTNHYFKLSAGPGKKDFYLLLGDYTKVFLQVSCIEQDNEGLATLNVSIDSLKRIYVGKTVWATNYRLLTHNPSTGIYNALTIETLRFAPVKIVDIKPSPSENNPIRVIVTTNQNVTGYEDIALRKNLLITGYFPSVNDKVSAEKIQTIDEAFFLKDPRITYNLTPAKLAAIKKGDLVKGMDRDMIMLIAGRPDEINDDAGIEQWVYTVGGKHYLYFRNGKYVYRN